MNDQAAACLMFGIYEKCHGIIDRHECPVCHGDRCPYCMEEPEHGACPHCFGTGVTPVAAFELSERADAICMHCGGTGRV